VLKIATLVAACLTILSALPVWSAAAAQVLRIGWLEDASGRCQERLEMIEGGQSPRCAEEAEKGVNDEARLAFIELLASSGLSAQYFGFSATPQQAPRAVELLEQAKPVLILVSGLGALDALLAAEIRDVPVLALTADCTPEAVRSQRQDEIPPNYHLFPSQYWSIRLQTFIQYTGASRLGFILPPDELPDSGKAASIIVAAANEVAANEIGISWVKLASLDDYCCREAVNELFFEEIDALLVDGSGCFGSGVPSEAENELWTILRQRGILPLSLTDPGAVHRGALLAPASWPESGENARLGRLAAVLALERFNLGLDLGQNGPADGDGTVEASVGPDLAHNQAYSRPGSPTPDNLNGLRAQLAHQAKFSLNLDTAEAMGFDPSASLIARITTFIRQQTP
jgi:hypothetical protein